MASTSMIPMPKVSYILQNSKSKKSSNQSTEKPSWLSSSKSSITCPMNPECEYFIIGEDEPGVFRWTEGWTKDMDWINEVQLKKQYCESYFKATAPLLIQSERKLQVKDFDLKDLLTEMQRNWNILHYLMRCLCLKSIS